MGSDHVDLLVLALAEVRVDHDRAVVAAVDALAVVAIAQQCARMTPSSCQGVVEQPG